MSWMPVEEIKRLRKDIDEVFDSLFTGETSKIPMVHVKHSTPVDLYETISEVVVVADLPGLSKEDIDIQATSDSITIQAESREGKDDGNEGYYIKERGSLDIYRRLPLPKRVDPNKAEAAFKNGILTVRLAKAQREEQESVPINITQP